MGFFPLPPDDPNFGVPLSSHCPLSGFFPQSPLAEHCRGMPLPEVPSSPLSVQTFQHSPVSPLGLCVREHTSVGWVHPVTPLSLLLWICQSGTQCQAACPHPLLHPLLESPSLSALLTRCVFIEMEISFLFCIVPSSSAMRHLPCIELLPRAMNVLYTDTHSCTAAPGLRPLVWHHN